MQQKDKKYIDNQDSLRVDFYKEFDVKCTITQTPQAITIK
jgi:hypothetical protein